MQVVKKKKKMQVVVLRKFQTEDMQEEISLKADRNPQKLQSKTTLMGKDKFLLINNLHMNASFQSVSQRQGETNETRKSETTNAKLHDSRDETTKSQKLTSHCSYNYKS